MQNQSGAPSSYSPTCPPRREAAGGFAICGERDEPRERESGRGTVGLHKGGGREGEQDRQTRAARLIRRRGDGRRGVGRGN